ncbi:HlyD family efflux transporter periplasmic adaptor subunit [Rugamonas sp. CCM 8940]|uniref:HlyD family efflux transporter periplasmic adaptor subunit n=1 Tax=Rugamonas sp. CCM 8940 TaxID=2765359 RepID=UPI0018F31E0B|nr:HlyD family efflux transporter periplasmic adaptor subunit [Rugamonas sp. CCM 8940]MBJ7313043.1 HlyD family efflux transporter periplasmic adaptor subunit [Rugamonas sp. CCM 8940]
MNNTENNPNIPATKRPRHIVTGLGATACVAVLAVGAWWIFSDDPIRSTDDAYVGGQVVQLTAQVHGMVSRVLADNSDRVAAGAPLVEIDPADARIELAAAEAQLAQALRSVRGFNAGAQRYRADIEARQAELDRAQADLATRKTIAASGAVTAEEVRHAADAVRSAKAALQAARQMAAQALTQISGASVSAHPAVDAAAQRVRAAQLALLRGSVQAPVAGMVAQRSVQLGRRVQPGERLMSIVPLDRLWVDANFKEVQLKGVCPQQAATVTADVYGKSVVYHGHVEDIEAGTGAAFALLPAQNATGNWIKVVQRVPVRIRLERAELLSHPLRIGMSTRVSIDTSNCPAVGATARAAKVDDASALYAAQSAAADVHVRQLIDGSVANSSSIAAAAATVRNGTRGAAGAGGGAQ